MLPKVIYLFNYKRVLVNRWFDKYIIVLLKMDVFCIAVSDAYA